MRNGKRAASVVAVTAMLALVAASTAPAKRIPPSPLKPIMQKVAGKTIKQREAILYQLAQQEGGQVNWYTSLSKDIYPGIVTAFEKAYPAVKLNVYRGHSEDVTAKLYQEEAAGTSGADVVETNGSEMSFYQHAKDILVEYGGSPFRQAIPKQFRAPTWTGDRLEGFVLAWNTNLVKPGEQPKGWAGLADPKWKGKIEMEPTDIDWFAQAYLSLEQQRLAQLKPQPTTDAAKNKALKTIDAGLDQLFSNIAKNAAMVSGHTTEATLLAAGQYAICVSCHAQTIENLSEQKHAPVAFSPFAAPPIIRAQGVGIAYRLPHPAGAMLFYDFLLSPAGQSALKAGGAAPARPDMADPQLATSSKILMDLSAIVHHWKVWSDKYDSIVRLGIGS